MTDPPLPDSSELTREDFNHSGWKKNIGDTHVEDCSRTYRDFERASTEAHKQGELRQAKVLILLAASCSMRLTNESRTDPFKPLWVLQGRTSPTPDSFTESDINFFVEILDSVDQPSLKGRLADLIWLKKLPREIRFAWEAIDSYRSLDLTKETWVTEIGDCWKRALALSQMTGTASGERIQEMEAETQKKFDQATKEDNYFGHWLATTLREFRLGNDNQVNIAKRLKSIARELQEDGNFYAARDYYQLAGDWFSDADRHSKQVDMIIARAEGWAKEAEVRISSDEPNALAAIAFYQNAIQTYREIPGSERESRQVNQRIEELRHLHEDAGRRSLDEMISVRTPEIDITRDIKQAQEAVSGKDATEALNRFTSLYQIEKRDIQKSSEENIEKFPFTALMAWTMLNQDGRVAAKRPGIGSLGSGDQDEPAIWSQMVWDYGIRVGMMVEVGIKPALSILHTEHRFQESDFVMIARNSPIVPPGREHLFGKALFKGYDQDFISALHLLTPQIEHMVRYELKTTGVITTTFDQSGIEDEKGLSSLVEFPEFEQRFGEDLAFEIKALFCDHSGANLRNNVSHGLITQQECHSPNSIYAWWLALKVVFRTYWGAYQRYIAAQGVSEENSGQPE